MVRPESAFRRSGLPHMSEVCCELGFVEVVLPQTCLMTSWESMTRYRHPADVGACHASSGPRAYLEGPSAMHGPQQPWRTCSPRQTRWQQFPPGVWPASPTSSRHGPLSESRDNRCIRNTGNDSTYLGEAGDEGSERLPGLLPHGVKMGLHTVLLVRAGEVRREQRT